MHARPLVSATEAFSAGSLVRRMLALFIGVDLAIVMRYAAKDWPRPWLHILGENNTVTWLSSMQLSLIGWLAISLGLVIGLHRSARALVWQRLGWFGLGLSFLALSADESLQFHEHLTLAFTMPGFQTGDGLLLLIAMAGSLAACGLLLPQLLVSPLALRLFAGSCGLAVLSQLDDALALDRVFGWAPTWLKVAEMTEECLELLAEVGFIVALTVLLALQVSRMAVGGLVVARVSGAAPLSRQARLRTPVGGPE
jgi:hypothetical protein